ncbi:MAG: hypothetical protein Q8O25_16965 [Sulfurisoma sp.]|nr:hypothetical protein [Sulfurisoma sp.]
MNNDILTDIYRLRPNVKANLESLSNRLQQRSAARPAMICNPAHDCSI